MSWLAGLASGLGELVSGGLDFWASERDRQTQMDINRGNLEMANRQMDLQKQFAKEGIQWKVQDAIKAGLHPLAALGASTAGFSPVSVSQEAPQSSIHALARMGQNVTRAVTATQTREQRLEEAARLVNMNLQNRLLEEQVKGAQIENMSKVGPPMPSTVQYMTDPSGRVIAMPSEEFKRSANIANEIGWQLENKLIPWFEGGPKSALQVRPGVWDTRYSSRDWYRKVGE